MEPSAQIMNEIESKLNKVSAALADDFRKLLEAGKITLFLHPEMLGACQVDWVKDAIVQHSQNPLSYQDFHTQTQANALPEPMPEADGKTLIALAQEINHRLDEHLTIVVSNSLKHARLETHLVKEAKEYVAAYVQKVEAACTLGLGEQYRDQFTKGYGTPIAEPEGFQWNGHRP